jgi:beta-glucuronidase
VSGIELRDRSEIEGARDWNRLRGQLLSYEGPLWCECDFDYRAWGYTKLFLLIRAVKCISSFWGNGRRVCQHEGGFTSFNCGITAVADAGDNFVVAAVDYRWREDGVPNLETDSWNCRGQMKALPLLEVQDTFSGYFHSPIRSASGAWTRRPSNRHEHRIPRIY